MECARPAAPARGITLIEQAVVVAIVALLLCIATPALYAMLKVNQVRLAQNDILSALHYARATASTTGARMLFCPSADHMHCAPSTRWEGGWLLGIDRDHDNQPDAGLRYTGVASGRGLRIRSSSGRQLVRFQADGSAGGSNLTLVVCQSGPGANPALGIVVSNSGRIRGAPASAAQAAACTGAPE